MASKTNLASKTGIILFCIAIFLIPVSELHAQKYHIKRFSKGEGLPSDSVNVLHQTSEGFLMIATKNQGLLRFNGSSSEVFDEANGLNGTDVQAIFEDSQKQLWLATASGGIGRLKADSIYYPYKERQIQHQEVLDIQQDKFNQLWLATQSSGIFVGNKFSQITSQDGLPSNTVNDLLVLNEDVMLVATTAGLALIDIKKQQVKRVYEVTEGRNCTVIFKDRQSRIWIGTDDSVIRISENDPYLNISRLAGVKIGRVTDIIENLSGNIMIGTEEKGLFEIQKNIVKHITKENNLPSNEITDLYKDSENRTWVTTKGGGMCLFLDESFLHYPTKLVLGTNNILSIHIDSTNELWIGTPRGLALVNTKTMDFDPVPMKNPDAIWAIEELSKKIFLLVGDNGIYQYNRRENRVEKFAIERYAFQQVNDVLSLDENNLLLATNRGLYQLKDNKIQPVEGQSSAKTVDWDIMRDSRGTIWISTNHGIFTYENGSLDGFEILDNRGYDGLFRFAVEDKKGNIWFGSNQGIIEYSATENGKKVSMYDNSSGLFSVNTQFLTIDNHQQLWHGTSAGLHKLNLEKYWETGELPIAHYGLNFNRLGMEFNHNAVATDQEGVIWFGSQEGLVKYDPKNSVKERYGPDVYFTDINLGIDYYDGYKYNTSIELDYPISNPSNINLSHWEHNLNFSFEGVDYQHATDLYYRYKLEGADSSWSEMTTANSATFQDLRPGTYKFMVEARNSDELWSEKPASITFTIARPTWSTYWFNGMLILTLLGLLYGGSRIWLNTYEKKKLKRLVDHQTKELREGLKEKEVLLAEIHHRVKNNLAVISGLLELQLDSVMEPPAVRALVEAKTRIQSIAMIHEKLYQNDTLANINFKDYIEQLASMIAQSYNKSGTEVSLQVDTQDIAITIDQSIPCGLILNEILSNAYEHAFTDRKKGSICVSLTEVNREVTMIIRDNGKGLPEDFGDKQIERLGFTLVKTLSQQLSGKLKVENRGGAYFEITFPKLTKSNGHLV